MTAQTSVTAKAAAFAGELGDTGMHDVLSYLNQEDDSSTGEVPFGTMLIQGTAYNQAKAPTAQSAAFVGVVVHSHAYAKDTELGDKGLKLNATMSLLRRGRIWVYVPEAVTVGGTVRVMIDDNNDDQGDLEGPGSFRTSDVTGTHSEVLTGGARWMTATAGAGLALLELDMDALTTTNDS